MDLLVEAAELDENQYSCVNVTDPFTLEDVSSVDPKRIFNMQGQCFDLKPLFNWVYNLKKYTNPFTNIRFRDVELEKIKKETLDRFPLIMELTAIKADGTRETTLRRISQFTSWERLYINATKAFFDDEIDDLKPSIIRTLNDVRSFTITYQSSEGKINRLLDEVLNEKKERGKPIDFKRIFIFFLHQEEPRVMERYGQPGKMTDHKLKYLRCLQDILIKLFGLEMSFREIIVNPNTNYWVGPEKYLIDGKISVIFDGYKSTNTYGSLELKDFTNKIDMQYKTEIQSGKTLREFYNILLVGLLQHMKDKGYSEQIKIMRSFDISLGTKNGSKLSDYMPFVISSSIGIKYQEVNNFDVTIASKDFLKYLTHHPLQEVVK